MTKEEYINRMKEDEEWAPGWEAIDAEFDRLIEFQIENETDSIIVCGTTGEPAV